MSTTIAVAVDADTAAAIRNVDRFEGRLGRLGGAAGRVGRLVGGSLATMAVGAGAVALKTIDSASKAQQSVGATRSVFGKYADDVIRQSRRADQALGLSQNEYRELANVTGAMLQSSGMSVDKTTGLVDRLNTRAADMAATFGGTTREAVEAVSAALRGETDPIERYGVSIRQADIDARLAAKGLDDLEGSALKQAQAQARLDLIFQQTSRSAGQFRRETNTLAGQQQIFEAQLENLSAKLGRRFLPIATQVTSYANDKLIPMFDNLIDGLSGKGSAELGETGDLLRDIWTEIQTLGPAIRDASGELPSLNDALSVTKEVLAFAADNVDLLADALPFLVAGFVAVKAAQLASNVAIAASPILRLAEIRATKAQTVALRELTAAQTAQGGVASRAAAAQATTAATTATNSRAASAAQAQQTTTTRTLATAQTQQAATARASAAANATVGTGATAAAGRMSRLALATRGAAGLGGMAGLTAGATTTDKTLSTLANTAGGALMGFAVGGPIGAAIGGGAGLLLSLATNAGKANDAMSEGEQVAEDYAGTLDQVSGAATRATRAEALRMIEQENVRALSGKLGIATRDLIGSILGEEEATGRVNRAYRERADQLNGSEQARFLGFLREQTDALSDQAEKLRQNNSDTMTWKQALSSLPRDVRIQLRQLGFDPTRRQMQRIIRDADDLSAKQIRVLIREFGAGRVVRNLKDLRRNMEAPNRVRPDLGPWGDLLLRGVNRGGRNVRQGTGRIRDDLERRPSQARPNLRPFLGGLEAGVGAGERVARRGGGRIADELRDGTRKARPDLNTFADRLNSGLAGIEGQANAGGSDIGNGIGAGIKTGLNFMAPGITSAARSIVANAIDAAKSFAEIFSPSRKTRWQGQMLGRGWIAGVNDEAPNLNRRVRNVVAGAMTSFNAAMRTETRTTRAQADARNVSTKYLGTMLERTRQMTSNLDREDKAQARLIDRLGKVRDRLRDVIQARRQYASELRGGILESGSLLGLEETHLGDPDTFLDQRAAKVRQALEYERQVARLRRSGLNQRDLRELERATPEEGGLVADMLLAGGPPAIRRANALARQLAQIGQRYGNAAARDYRAGGARSARELLRGLESERRNLDRSATRTGQRFGDRMGRAIRDRISVTPLRVDVRPRANRPQLAPATYARTQRTRVELRLTAQQVDQLSRGRAIRADLDAWERVGGRSRR